MQDMREFIEQMNNNGEFIGKHTVMQEFVKRATSGISKPIEVEKLDDILIDEGITEEDYWRGMDEAMQDEEGDEPFCNCSTGHGIEEMDWNQCDSCGKPIYDLASADFCRWDDGRGR